ncbi:MAG: hypothetical protein IPP91_11350 [Betaproteobacteria bacterium]|nr:hypothetical protein [Betaproteobacteria bacterium]
MIKQRAAFRALLLAGLIATFDATAVDHRLYIEDRPPQGTVMRIDGLDQVIGSLAGVGVGMMRMMARSLSMGPRVDLVVTGLTYGPLDMYTSSGSPIDPLVCVLTINSNGILVGQGVRNCTLCNTHLANEEALRTGTGWPAGSALYIINKGVITGAGGRGGHGQDDQYYHPWNGFYYMDDGEAGSDAMYLQFPISIDNSAGYIGGGGGGGAGGGGVQLGLGGASGGGGGGGSGYGTGGGAGAYGGAGNGASAGAWGGGAAGAGGADGFYGQYGGAGGAGGGPGLAGANGSPSPTSGGGSGGSGGWPGYAIRTNGYVATFTGGYNGTQVAGTIG